MRALFGTIFAALALSAAMAETRVIQDVAYVNRPGCLLDVRVPIGATNFATIIWFHGGGLTSGSRHFVSLTDDGIAQIAVGYRLLGECAKRGEDCIDDAAASVAWTLRHIGDYGGDANKVFVSGMSAGGYLAMMVGMDSKWLAAHGARNVDLAGIVAISGQATKHFNVRKFAGDDDPQFLPKIDALAPLAHVSADIPPILCVCGQPPYEWKCRSEENRLLIASCIALGHENAKFVELDYCDHGRAYTAGLPYLEMFVNGTAIRVPHGKIGCSEKGSALCRPAPPTRPEVTWSVMHPTPLDPAYMARVVEKAVEYGGSDSFEVCGTCHSGMGGMDGNLTLELSL